MSFMLTSFMPFASPFPESFASTASLQRGRRGFVAAPLVGTLIFFIAIVFVVNVSKFEAGEVAQITSDAYHNRLVSVMEIYRMDLSAIFTENLGRVTEAFLTSPGWYVRPFAIFYNPDSTFDCNGRGDNETEERYCGCLFFNTLIKNIIGSFDNRFGLLNWMMLLNATRSYEGLTFGPANQDSFKAFFEGKRSHSVSTDSGPAYFFSTDLSERLLDSAFDCHAFAYQKKMQCCRNVTQAMQGLKCTDVLPGCESGFFYIRVLVEDPNIFKALPRLFMDDGAGNIVRSGAIADRDLFVPVNFPLFRYYNDTFKFYEHIAFGKAGTDPHGVSTNKNEKEEGGLAEDFEVTVSTSSPLLDDIKNAAVDAFYKNALTIAYQVVKQGKEYNITLKYLTQDVLLNPNADTPTNEEKEALKSILSAGLNITSSTTGGTARPYANAMFTFHFTFIDRSPVGRVKPTENNYSWVAYIIKS